MDQKTVLITGANSGIGLATAKKFLKNEYIVFANYHKSNDNLLKLNNKNIITTQGDLTQPVEIENLIKFCLSKRNRLDILINNAAVQITSNSIEDIDLVSYEYVMALNIRAPYILSQLVMQQMKKQSHGRIINISSIGVKYGGNPVSATYTISKAALEAMTLSFAKAGAPFNVFVNAVRAGITDTNFLKHNPKKDLKKRVQLIPLRRLGKPSEIANTIYFLSSEESSYTTGSIITVAGGD